MGFWKKLEKKLSADDLFSQSAALSYYTALAFAPLVTLLLGLLSTLGFALQGELAFQIRSLVGEDAALAFEIVANKAQERKELGTLAAIWSTILLLVSASIVFVQLQSSINRIFEVEENKPFFYTWREKILHFLFRRLISIGIVLSFIFLSVVSLVVSAALSFFSDPEAQIVGRILQTTGNFLIFSILFAAIFQWLPDRKLSWRESFKSGLLTALLFTFGKWAIGMYLGHTAISSAYGAAGSLVVLLVWVYYSSLIFLFGAEISAVKNRRDEKLPKGIDASISLRSVKGSN